MKTMILIFIFFIMACGGGDESPLINDEPQVYVCMGDSITAGDFVKPEECYVELLRTKLKNINIFNKGVPGAKSFEGAAAIGKILDEYKPDVLTIYYGTNDIGFYGTETIMESLTYMVQYTKLKGATPVIATLGPFLADWAWRAPHAIALNKKIRELAKKENIQCVDLEISMNWNPDLMVMPDGEHPNAKGHKVIAETFYEILKNMRK